VDDFFDALSGELANYSRSISRKIKSYSSKLTALNDHILFRITDSIVDKFIESDLSSQYDEINLSIKDLNKRLIIFIDDVDRLNRNEVFEVLRLIRNTANFANTFFIVAYDKEYVVESLKLSNIPSYNNYLEKIFQIEVPLPNYDKNILVNQFQILLLSYVQNEDEKNELRSAFNTLENYSEFRYDWLSIANIDKLMEKYLNNLRDVIRISNSFILLYHNLKGEVDLKELLVLEMIKSRFTVVYNLLASKKILNLKSENRENRFSVDVEVLNKYIAETKLYSIEDQELIIESVNFLYNRSQEFTMRSVTLPQNHFIYFSYQNFDHVPLVQFNKFRNGNLEDFLKQLDVWYKEGKKDLQNLFIETNEYNGKSDFEIMIKAMLYLSKYDIPNWDINLFKKVSSIDDIVIKYYKNDFDEYRNFLNLLFENAIYPYYGEVKLLYNFLYRIIKKDLFTNLFSKDDLQTKLLFYFRQVLTKKNKVDNEVFELYYSNLEDIVNSRIILNEHANELFREFIKQNWKSYLQLLPRRKYIGGNESVYVLEPFLKQTFGTYPNFKSFLYSLPDEDPCVQAIKIFFAEYERNNYESFKIQNEKIFDKCNPDALK
ncbi:MAG: P-loop NTPase fold protein, partial [Nitrososphaeraceae archaeon]